MYDPFCRRFGHIQWQTFERPASERDSFSPVNAQITMLCCRRVVVDGMQVVVGCSVSVWNSGLGPEEALITPPLIRNDRS